MGKGRSVAGPSGDGDGQGKPGVGLLRLINVPPGYFVRLGVVIGRVIGPIDVGLDLPGTRILDNQAPGPDFEITLSVPTAQARQAPNALVNNFCRPGTVLDFWKILASSLPMGPPA